MIKKEFLALTHLSEALKKDKDLLLYTLDLYGSYIYYGSETILLYFDKSFRDDEEIVLKAVGLHPMALQYASERLQNNTKIVLEAVNKTFYRRMHLEDAIPLAYAGPKPREEEEVVFTALKNYPESLQCVSASFQKKHESRILELVKNKPFSSLQYLNNTIQETNKELIAELVSNDNYLLKYAYKNFYQDYPELVLNIIKSWPYALNYVNEAFQEQHQDIILAIIKQHPDILGYVTKKIPEKEIQNALIEGFQPRYTSLIEEISGLNKHPAFKDHPELINNLAESLLNCQNNFLKDFTSTGLLQFKNECKKIFQDTENKMEDKLLWKFLRPIANKIIKLFNLIISSLNLARPPLPLFFSASNLWKDSSLKNKLFDQLDETEQHLININNRKT